MPPIVQNQDSQEDTSDTEAQQDATESMALDAEEAKVEEEELIKIVEEEERPVEDPAEPPKKKRRALERLEAFNTPTTASTVKDDPEVGNMVVVKQEGTARIGEVLELKEEEVTIHWYGSTTTRSLPRSRWKLYPGWEKEDGTMEYIASHVGGVSGSKPATCDVKRSEIFLVFNRLTVKSGLPADVLKEIQRLSL